MASSREPGEALTAWHRCGGTKDERIRCARPLGSVVSALAPPMAVVISGGALARGGRWRGGAPGKTGPPRPAPPRVGSGVVGGVVAVIGGVVVVGGVVAVVVCVELCIRVLPGGSPAPLPPAARSAFGAVGRPLRL